MKKRVFSMILALLILISLSISAVADDGFDVEQQESSDTLEEMANDLNQDLDILDEDVLPNENETIVEDGDVVVLEPASTGESIPEENKEELVLDEENVNSDVDEFSNVIDGEEEGYFDAAMESVAIDQAVLFDQEGIRITAKNLETDGWSGPELKMLFENNTNRRVTVQCRNASVNGYMIDTIMSCDLAAGKKANDSLIFVKSSLAQAGIDTIANMEFSFHIFDSDTWDTIIDSEMISIDTPAAAEYEYTFDNSGNSVYNENGLEFVVKGLNTDSSLFGPSIVVFLRNSTGLDLTVQVRDVSVNGFMVNSIFSCDLMNGKCAIDTITLMSSDLEENCISEINEVELYFHVFTMAGWNTVVDTPVVKIVFPISQKDGLVRDDDGIYRYYENNKFVPFSGIADYQGGSFFVANGVLCSDANGLNLYDGVWYFLSQGQVQKQYSGLALYDGEWFYIVEGILNDSKNGLILYDGGQFLVAAGRICYDVSGPWQNSINIGGDNKWYFLSEGQVQTQYTGLAQYDGAWFYIIGGLLADYYTGTVEYNGSQFQVVNGQVVF